MEGKVVIIGKCVFNCVNAWVLCMWCFLIYEYVSMYDGLMGMDACVGLFPVSVSI